MQKVREVYEQKNTERCKRVFSTVTTLADNVRDACQIVESGGALCQPRARLNPLPLGGWAKALIKILA